MDTTYFNFDGDVTILFTGWHVNTAAGIFGSCVAIFALAFFFEVLKTLRGIHLRNAAINVKQALEETITEKSHILEKHAEGEIRMLSWPHVIQTLLQILQTTIGYILMLIVMTYNMWLILSILIGTGVGYFLSAWKRKIVADIEKREATEQQQLIRRDKPK